MNAVFEEGQTTIVTDVFIYLSPFPSVFTSHAYTPVTHPHVRTGASAVISLSLLALLTWIQLYFIFLAQMDSNSSFMVQFIYSN